MNAIDRVQLLAELEDGHCELNHGPKTNNQDFRACDYLVLPVGYQEDEAVDVVVRELVVPVCYDCAQALLGEEWTLLYCFECNSSQWIYRKLARFRYRHHVIWLRGCPDCADEFGGIYFNDYPVIAEEINFLSKQAARSAA